MIRSRLRTHRGITILEITLLLTVTTALVGALTPAVAAFIQDARIATATAYMAQLKTAILASLSDIGFPEFKVDDTPTCNASATDGCGGTAVTSTGMCCTTRTKSWVRPVDADSDASTIYTFVDFFDRHLVLDAPGNNTGNAYVTSWQGAYLNAPIDPDPWGNRYMFSAENLNLFPGTADLLSAGPDEAVDTTWDLATTTAGADDLVLFVQ